MPALNQPTLASTCDTLDESVMMLAQTMVSDFLRQGWAVHKNFLPATRWRELAAEAQQLWEQAAFHKAGIGGVSNGHVQAEIRGDDTLWLDPQRTPTACEFVASELEVLRRALNASTYLGLFEFEGHLARYPAGAGYQRHLDQLRGTQSRRVSVVVYLNEAWRAADGGELYLYPRQQPAGTGIAILPSGGTLVIFESAHTPHEVRPARRTRLSLSGWLRTRA